MILGENKVGCCLQANIVVTGGGRSSLPNQGRLDVCLTSLLGKTGLNLWRRWGYRTGVVSFEVV
jgi:hypothetical protein